jgi:hypothetical protein
MLRGPTEPKKPFFNLIRRESSSSPSCSEAFSLPTIDESLDEDDRTGDDTSTSSFSFSISPLSFTQRNLDLSYGDLNEDVNLKSFSEDYDDDISTSSAEDSHVTQVHFQDLRRKLQETEKAKRDLLTQCLKLNKRVTSQLQESTTTYTNSLKKENDKTKVENRNMEQDFANDIRALLS